MTFEEIKVWIEANKGTDENLKTYLQGLNPLTVESVSKFLTDNGDGKKWLDSEKDKHHNKAFETWKTNNLQKLIDEEVAKKHPNETPEQKRIRELEEKIAAKEKDEAKQKLINKGLTVATEKKLPTEIVDYLIGADEESTLANIGKFETVFNTHVQKLVEEKVKGKGYIPPGGGGGGDDAETERFKAALGL